MTGTVFQRTTPLSLVVLVKLQLGLRITPKSLGQNLGLVTITSIIIRCAYFWHTYNYMYTYIYLFVYLFVYLFISIYTCVCIHI